MRPPPTYPETEEGVALVLMDRVLEAEDKNGSKTNERPREYLFRLYAECLAAAKSRRDNDAWPTTLH